jgi:hypothetical protein
MKKFNRYQNVKTGKWIKYEIAQKKHIKVKGFSSDYKHSKIFVPPPKNHLNFRLAETGKFINKYKSVNKKVIPELYKGKKISKNVLPRKYSETELKLIISKYKGIAKKGTEQKEIPKKQIELTNKNKEFLNDLIENNNRTSYDSIRKAVVNSFVDYAIPKSLKISKSHELKIKAKMIEFVNNLSNKEQKNLTQEQLLDIYETSRDEIDWHEIQTDIPF